MTASKKPTKIQAKKKKNIAVRILLLLIFCLGAYGLIMIGAEPVSTETVRHGTIEDKLSTSGYILRKETVIKAPSNGIISCVVPEGERVNKNAKVLSVFEGKFDENLQSKINNINNRIEQLERSKAKSGLIIGDIIQIENRVAKTVEDIIEASYQRDIEKVSEYKNDLDGILAQRAKELGGEVQSIDKAGQLAEEKKRLEAQSGGKRIDLYAPVSGVFSTDIDGFESHFDLSDPNGISPELLEQANEIELGKGKGVSADGSVAKIVDNYEWFYAATVDAKCVWDVQAGEYVLLRFPEFSEKTLDANVSYISDEKDGKVSIVIACMQYFENIYSTRKANVEIIRKRHSGFKVPIKAIRVKDDGTNGVYIIKENIALFKEIEVLYKGDEYVIAKEDNNAKNGLLLYDEMVISGNNVAEGKVVR
ncbi:MAG: hypothetical protein M0R40_01535 [Firmicutes bacterium]|nr:hypothetical protein [Bacillota bacterium]